MPLGKTTLLLAASGHFFMRDIFICEMSHKFPDGRALRDMVKRFTGTNYIHVRRTRTKKKPLLDTVENFSKTTNVHLLTDWALVQMMRDARLRAPHKPLGCDNTGTLYRGISMSRSVYAKFLFTRRLPDPSFASFTTDPKAAMDFGDSAPYYNDKAKHHMHAILVLRTADVPTGTPWLWFGNACGRYDARNKNRLPSVHYEEEEVLLPPGTYRIAHVARVKPDRRILIEVTYRPDYSATSSTRAGSGPLARPRRIFPRSFVPSKKNRPVNGLVNGYAPLHALLSSTT